MTAPICYHRAGMARAMHFLGAFTAAAALLGAQSLPPKLVEFTVVALDEKGKPIADLRRDEIFLTQDGFPRDVTTFRYEGRREPATSACEPGFFTNRYGCAGGTPPNLVISAPEPSLASLELLAKRMASVSGRKSILMPAAAPGSETLVRTAAQHLATLDVAVYPLAGPSAPLLADITGGRIVENEEQGAAIAANDLHGAYTVGFFSPGEQESHWHDVTVTLWRRGARLIYRQGYLSESIANRDWPESQWAVVMSEPAGASTLPLDATCDLAPGSPDSSLTCKLQVSDRSLGFLPAPNEVRGEIETGLVEKQDGGISQVQKARSGFHVFADDADNLSTKATQVTERWKISSKTHLVRLVVRDRLTDRYATLDLPVERIPPPKPATAQTAAVIPRTNDPFIEKARDAALSFLSTLPNYVVKADTSRQRQVGNTGSWSEKDRIVAEVVYEEGRETTRNATLNGEAATVLQLEQTGTWSTGQFAGTLRALFEPESRAVFKERGGGKVAGRDARVYDYSIEKANSGWVLSAGDATYVPAYHGTIWLERDTARTLKFEMKARGLPRDFPFDRAESSTEFAMVHIGNSPYLMPAHSEAMACTRIPPNNSTTRRSSLGPTDTCSRNVIQFSGYRQFGVESNITFGPGK